MKTPEEIIRWCDMMLEYYPNTEDINFFNSIKGYMKEQRPHDECPCDRCPVDYEEEGCCCERYIQWRDMRGDKQ